MRKQEGFQIVSSYVLEKGNSFNVRRKKMDGPGRAEEEGEAFGWGNSRGMSLRDIRGSPWMELGTQDGD